MLSQIQRSKVITEVFLEWLEGIIQVSIGYIKDLSKVYDDVVVVIKELEIEMASCKKEEAKWLTVIAQMNGLKI